MRIKNKLQKIIVSKKYMDSISDFIKTYGTVADLQSRYFKNYTNSKKAQLPEEKLSLIREYSINSTVHALTESGLNVNVLDKVEDIIRQNTTTGGSYSSLQGQLRDFILSDKNTDGALMRYTKTITTDAINQYSRQHLETTAADLDMPWRKYIGSLKTTSREWCEKMVAKKFVHVSELAELVKGNIDGHQCGIYKKTADNKGTDLPYGMIAGTNAQNVLVRAGGHGCEHGFYPCSEDEVPKEILDKFYNRIPEKEKQEDKPEEKDTFDKINFSDEFKNKNLVINNQVHDKLKKLGYTEENMVNIVGGVFNKDFKNVEIKITNAGTEGVKVIAESNDYQIERILHPDRKEVYNSQFFISGKGGEGNGIKAFVNQINELKKLGYEKMSVSAALGSKMNGAITWARFGYKMKPESITDFKRLMLKNNRKEKDLLELMSTQEGVAFWKKNAFWFEGEFDLKNGSDNLKALQNYLNEKQLNYEIIP